jgi:serine phosphatase RsbU (regulator of sigma subunit)
MAVAQAILRAVRDHIGDRPQEDDLTILCIGRID